MTDSAQQAAPLRVVVFADFVCPYSYLAVDQIDRLAREYDIRPLWRPHWLHPETPLEGTPREKTPESAAKRERLHAWVKEMAPEQYPRIRFRSGGTTASSPSRRSSSPTTINATPNSRQRSTI
jgi:predicted DsbA family dithiol-disulfide isomerase